MLNDDMDTASTNAMAPLTVVNTHAFDLPQTGENSVIWMPIVGGTMMGIAVLAIFILFVLPKRKEEDLA